MKTLTCALLIGALAAAAVGATQGKDPVKPEMPYETASRLLGFEEEEEPKYRDSDATTEALRALFAASNAVIPASSSCFGHYRWPQKETVKDMLAVWMSNLDIGKNELRGNCQAGQCAVYITHSEGEEVSSAIIVFDTVRGKASMPTLQCLMTP